ncbi:hypothetical protein M099_3988 [Phocaeicola vulgatus str. 3975 RP4]|uniref:Uncharacterized protein n=1 Tax=Phocaeicola vulgatus str. 3975 RP4 TaxID=1339352 RepID=A0A069S6U9_PHOVU|nr:hypothetical protein M099_3988 [Phocaeicola vulgatus str. 3975 RP4]
MITYKVTDFLFISCIFSEFFWNNVLFLSRYVTEGNTETFHLLFSPKRIL